MKRMKVFHSHTVSWVHHEADVQLSAGTGQSKPEPLHCTNSFWGAQPSPQHLADPAAPQGSAQKPSKFERLVCAPGTGWPWTVLRLMASPGGAGDAWNTCGLCTGHGARRAE